MASPTDHDDIGLPPLPGTAPIPEGHVRLFHQTQAAHLEGIRSEGIHIRHARGIEGPKAIYADEGGFYGKPGDVPTVEFHVPKEHWSRPFVRTPHVTPDQIVAIHEPWHRTARFIHAEVLDQALAGEFDHLKDRPSKDKSAIEHLQARYGKPSLAKSLQIEERYHHPDNVITLRVRRHDNPAAAVTVTLAHGEEHAPGEWLVDNITPHRDGTATGSYTEMQGKFGPSHMRELVRHVQATYGITKLVGSRITGARAKAEKPDVSTARVLTKAQATFRTLDAHWGDDDPAGVGEHRLSVEVMHPNGEQGAVVHLQRYRHMPEGHFRVADVEPVDETRSIDGKTYSRNFANRLGPSVMRQAARYLRETHGVTHITGHRITGARFPGHGEDGADEGRQVGAALTKAATGLAKGFERNDDYRPPRSLRLVPRPVKTDTVHGGRLEITAHRYDIFDSLADDTNHPIGQVSVNKKTRQADGHSTHSVHLSGDFQGDQGLGVQGLKSVAKMVAKMHPELREFAVSRQKAGVRQAIDSADRDFLFPGMSFEERKARVSNNVRSLLEATRAAEGATAARGISPYQQKTHPNPFAKSLEADEGGHQIEHVASYYETPGARHLAHLVKTGDPDAITQMGHEMAPHVGPGVTLIPVPGRNGEAHVTLRLAHVIAAKSGATVANVLRGTPRESLYHLKKTGQGLPDLGLTLSRSITGPHIAIDNVAATGHTARAVRALLPEARFLVHSIDHTAGHDPVIAKSLDGHDPIVAPAIRLHTGHVITAPRYPVDDPRHDPTPIHGDAAVHALQIGHNKSHVTAALLRPSGTGFVTRSGKYIPRREAIPHALAHDQVQADPRHIERLRQQYAAGKEDVSLDSGDLAFAKAIPRIRLKDDFEEDGHRMLTLDLLHPDGVNHARLALFGGPERKTKGYVADIFPIPHGDFVAEGDMDRKYANQIGPAGIRHVARHLRDTYGITKVSGMRVTGARNPGHGSEGGSGKPVTRDLAKALHIEEEEHDPNRTIRLKVARHDNPDIHVHVSLSHDDTAHMDGHWVVDNITPQAKPSQYGVSYSTHKNQFGATHMRALVQHLQKHYGVESVEGRRVTGARAEAQKTNKATTVLFNKDAPLANGPIRKSLEGEAPARPRSEGGSGKPVTRDLAKAWAEGDADAWKGEAPPRLSLREDPSSHHEVTNWHGGKSHVFLFDVHDRTMEGVAGRVIVRRETIGKTPVYSVGHISRGSPNDQAAHAKKHGPVTPGDLLGVVRQLRQHFPDMKLVDRSYEMRPKAGPRRELAASETLHDMMAVGAGRREQVKLQDEKREAEKQITSAPGSMTPVLRQLPDTRKSLEGEGGPKRIRLTLGRKTAPPLTPEWHTEDTQEHPMNPRKRVVTRDGAMGTYEVTPDLMREKHVRVHEIQAVTRGGGRAAMEHLTEQADRHGVTLSLSAEPLKPTGEGKQLSSRALKRWYKTHGFTSPPGSKTNMVRRPER